MYEFEGRKYIDIDDTRIKIPFRYNKIVGVESKGIKTLYELRRGDTVSAFTCNKKIWNGSVYYVLKYIDTD